MNLETYRRRRLEQARADAVFRNLCLTCRQPEFGCFCPSLRPFDPRIKFVILIHPIEVRRRIATGRMSHLSLENSELIQGQDFCGDARVNALLNDPTYQPVVLYPGSTSVDLSDIGEEQRTRLFRKTPLIFVIDGTWATAKKTMRSKNLENLPRICFTPDHPSRFRVRKQPGVDCFSTIEAIHQTIELLADAVGFDTSSRAHDSLLRVFDEVVERQLKYLRHNHKYPRLRAKV